MDSVHEGVGEAVERKKGGFLSGGNPERLPFLGIYIGKGGLEWWSRVCELWRGIFRGEFRVDSKEDVWVYPSWSRGDGFRGNGGFQG